MNALAPIVFLVAVAYANAGAAILAGPAGVVAAPGLGVVSARGALEGALGGQWIPDVPVHAPAAVVAAPAAYTAHVASPLAAHFAAPLAASFAAPYAAPIVAPGIVSKGALEGALGGQWVPDVLGK